jgi:hypothetical protein
LAERYEKLLLARLIDVAERLDALCPDLVEATGFRAQWSIVESLSGQALARAVRQPLLDAWVRSAERLWGLGLFQRYPEAHPGRHLREFSRLVLSWAEGAPDGTRGQVPLLGCRTVPLAFGEAILTSTAGPAAGLLEWRIHHGRLILELNGAEKLGDLDPGKPDAARMSSGTGWEIRCLPRIDATLILDLHSPEYCSFATTSDRQRAEALVLSDLEALADGPGEQLRTAVRSHLRCVTLRARREDEAWIAGLARWRLPASPASPSEDPPSRLLGMALSDRVQRLVSLVGATHGPIDEAVRRELVPLAARRLGERMLGRSDTSRGDGSEGHWRKLAHELSESESGRAILRELGEVPVAVRREISSAAGGSQNPLELTILGALTDLNRPPGAPFVLYKTRRSTRRTCKWRALDVLTAADPAALEAVVDRLRERRGLGESDAYGLAVAAYLLGRYGETRRAIATCLQHDEDVEEYWHLLAFAARHLGLRQVFERIVFDGDRDLALAAPTTGPGV